MELVPLVCLCLLSCSGETSAAGDGVTVVVEEDSDAVLPCSLSTKEDITGKSFDWKKDGQQVFFHSSEGHTNQGQQFKGRVSHFEDQLKNGNASIKITKTEMADSGNYSCIFPHLQEQTFYIQLVVGAAPEPIIKRPHDTNDWSLLQCEAHGIAPFTVEWKDSAGNTLKSESILKSGGGRSDITLNITVTKTDTYRCVATQKKISHQIFAETSVSFQGAAPEPGFPIGWIVGPVLGALLVLIVGGVYKGVKQYRKDKKKSATKEDADSVTSLRAAT